MNNVVNHPTCRHINALACVDAAHLAIENIAGLAGLLCKTIAHGAPLGVPELATVSNTVLWDADRLDTSFTLWRRLPADSLPSSRYRSLQRLVDTLRQHANRLGQAALCVDSGAPPTADQLTILAGRLLALTEPLRQAVVAAQAASIPPPSSAPSN